MKPKIIIFVFVVVILFQLTIEKKKKKSKNRKTRDPKSRRPEKISAELFCDSCQAILTEAMKELRGKKKESDVLDIMTNICNPEKYNVYRKFSFNNDYRLSST